VIPDENDFDVLRRIFEIAGKPGTSSRQRGELVEILERRICQLSPPVGDTSEHQAPAAWRCKAFGAKTPRELAAIAVAEFERMRVRAKSLTDFLSASRIEGYRNRLRGRLFHVLVRNFEPLQADFRRDAGLQLQELNDPQMAKAIAPGIIPDWINAKGGTVPRLQKFGRPRRAQDIRMLKLSGQTVEFVDDMYVSYADGPLGRLWTFLNEVEVKTAGAARGFAKQIGFAQIRLGAAELKAVEMQVEGFKRTIRVPPESIIFSQRSIGRNAITLLSNRAWLRLSDELKAGLTKAIDVGDLAEIYKRSDFRIQSTTQESIDSVFLRITLAIDSGYLNALVQAIWPRLVVIDRNTSTKVATTDAPIPAPL
jgi:hypothetical protein